MQLSKQRTSSISNVRLVGALAVILVVGALAYSMIDGTTTRVHENLQEDLVVTMNGNGVELTHQDNLDQVVVVTEKDLTSAIVDPAPFPEALVSRFNGNSPYDDSTGVLKDLSGNGHDSLARSAAPGVTVVEKTFGPDTHKVLVGPSSNTGQNIRWDSAQKVWGASPSTTTLFHVARYNGGTKQRLISSATTTPSNWHDGFYQGHSGTAYHGNGWLVSNTDKFQDNWVLSWSTKTTYHGYSLGGLNIYGSLAGATQPDNLMLGAIASASEFTTHWQIAEILIYDRLLSDEDASVVLQYLNGKYHVTPPNPFP